MLCCGLSFDSKEKQGSREPCFPNQPTMKNCLSLNSKHSNVPLV